MEAEAPDLLGHDYFLHNLAESSVRDRSLGELGVDFGNMSLPYTHHFGLPELHDLIAEMFAGNIHQRERTDRNYRQHAGRNRCLADT